MKKMKKLIAWMMRQLKMSEDICIGCGTMVKWECEFVCPVCDGEVEVLENE